MGRAGSPTPSLTLGELVVAIMDFVGDAGQASVVIADLLRRGAVRLEVPDRPARERAASWLPSRSRAG